MTGTDAAAPRRGAGSPKIYEAPARHLEMRARAGRRARRDLALRAFRHVAHAGARGAGAPGRRGLATTLPNRNTVVTALDFANLPNHLRRADADVPRHHALAAGRRRPEHLALMREQQGASPPGVAAADAIGMIETNRDFRLAIAAAGGNLPRHDRPVRPAPQRGHAPAAAPTTAPSRTICRGVTWRSTRRSSPPSPRATAERASSGAEHAPPRSSPSSSASSSRGSGRDRAGGVSRPRHSPPASPSCAAMTSPDARRDLRASPGAPEPGEAPDARSLSGVIDAPVTYHNEETGSAVLKVKAKGREDLATVVGASPPSRPGEKLEATGQWVVDRDREPQFKAEMISTAAPASASGIERYLASGLIRGIGQETAKKLVAAFGRDTLKVLDLEPERLAAGARPHARAGAAHPRGLDGAAGLSRRAALPHRARARPRPAPPGCRRPSGRRRSS